MPKPSVDSRNREAWLPCTYHLWSAPLGREWSIWFELLTSSISLLWKHRLYPTDTWFKHVRDFFSFFFSHTRSTVDFLWCTFNSFYNVRIEVSVILMNYPQELIGAWVITSAFLRGKRRKEVFLEIPRAWSLPFDWLDHVTWSLLAPS